VFSTGLSNLAGLENRIGLEVKAFKTSGLPAHLNPIAAENTKVRNEPRL